MEAYANALLYAIPGFVVLILIEIAYGHFTNKQTHTVMDTISSLSSGVTNIIKDSLGLVVALISYPFLLKYLAVFDIQAAWLVYVVAFIAIDFASYWNHRLCHKVNFFWNIHVIHHSSEEFNLACALRQTISNIIGYYPVFLIPAALFGVPHEVIGVLAPIHLFAQFWYHTKHIGKLGILEYVFVTPSQHRVHHAINDVYIDKNLAAIFCVWDRWFGTFQEELDDVPPVYGVLKPASTWNPIIINFQHLWGLIKDAWRTNNYIDKLRIWFMPTGWRPKDVAEKYPIKIIENPYNFKKYEARASSLKVSWSLLQLIATTLLMYFMFYNYVNLTTNELLTYGVIVFVGVFGYTTIMDNKKYGLIFELIFCGYGTYLIFTTGDWFGMNTYITYGSYLVLFYFGFTVLGAAYFSFLERKELAIT
jgi:sterol desaturase/sphingolipid hydroxylase (fatty acid hydroxylase superfamily)